MNFTFSVFYTFFRLQQEIYVALFEQIFSTKIKSRMTITTEDLMEDRKITTAMKFKIHPKSN